MNNNHTETHTPADTLQSDEHLPGAGQGTAGEPSHGGRRILSALEIARELGLNPPTDEQIRIIESPLQARLVIAGAGSGKTATMVDRVVWLVANGFVRADEVLGVTFTRKAAGELRERMRTRLNILRERKLIDLTEQELLEGASEPTVSTYHSYANTLVKDYGLRLGIEQDAQMLGDAQAWQLVAQIVQYWDGELPQGGKGEAASKTYLVKQVLKLAGECAEHLVAPQTVIEFCTAQIAAYESLSTPGPRKAANDTLRQLQTKIILARMVQRYARVKARMQVLDYGDLIALAARIARDVPQAVQLERERYKVVLLDEFQDTSHAQLQLFSDLFGTRAAEGEHPGYGEHPVMAVGDPKQSIYGFRGASDGQLFSFYRYFPTADETPLYLTVAWRNDTAILDAANLIAEPLKTMPGWVRASQPPKVPDLRPRSVITRPDESGEAAMRGSVQLARYATDADEARGIAEKIAAERARFRDNPTGMPTMAVLTRTRSQMEPIRQACEALGVPAQVVGLGGLLERPEVIDMVAMLRVLADPNRSDALVRLLAGARWRLGTADLLALGEWSNELTRVRERGYVSGADAQQPGQEASGTSDEQLRRAQQSFEEARKLAVEDLSEYGSLIEAIEHLPEANEQGHPIYPPDYSPHRRRLSVEGLARLRAFAAELEYLRQFTTEDLGTLLYEIERVMMLDIELASHEGSDSYTSRVHLDAFHDVAANYAATSPRINAMIYAGADGTAAEEDAPTARRFVLSASGISYLTGFLAWLEEAAEHENGLAPAVEEPRQDAVQILTMHASKGLEWDQVYLPRLSDARAERHRMWQRLEPGVLPWPLRGDKDYLPPALERPEEITALETFSELNLAVEEGEDMVHDYAGAEARRLIYVAMTRARSLLYITTCRWTGAHVKPVKTSTYWNELVQFSQGDAQAPYEGIQYAPWLYPGYLGTGYYVPSAARETDPSIDAVFGREIRDWGYTVPQGAVLLNGTPVPSVAPVADPQDGPARDAATASTCANVARALSADGADPIENARILRLPPVHRVYRAAHPDADVTAEFAAFDCDTPGGGEGGAPAQSKSKTADAEFVFAREELMKISAHQRPARSGVRPQIVQRLLTPAAWAEQNPQQGSVLTAMWPFDPLDGPAVWRWESDEALTEGMRAQLRYGAQSDDAHPAELSEQQQGPAVNRPQQVSVPGDRRARVERAALNVARGGIELAPGANAPQADAHTRQEIQDWEQEVELLLALARRAVTPAAPSKPEHLSASELMSLAENPQQARARMVRPVPVQPSAAARAGTFFHEWVENHFGADPMLDLDDELYADDETDTTLSLDALRKTFLASEWANRTIWRAEYPVETHVAGVSVRGRIDAVFRTVERTEQGQRERWELVDWKTGRKPTAKQMRYKRIQLALYRLAFAKIQGVDPADVRAAFYYVGSDQTVWDSDIAGGLQSEAQLERIITRWDWEP